jgi:deoxyribonuclease V
LKSLSEFPQVIVIDGYVWLGHQRPGLGAHLYEALGGSVAVIGVAKTSFVKAEPVVPVLRGRSRSPLHVTAVGMDVAEAASHIRTMHGPHRVSTLLKRVDQLSRGWACHEANRG